MIEAVNLFSIIMLPALVICIANHSYLPVVPEDAIANTGVYPPTESGYRMTVSLDPIVKLLYVLSLYIIFVFN